MSSGTPNHLPILIGLALMLASPAVADGDIERLETQVGELKAEVERLRAQVGDDGDWLTEQRAEEIRGLVEDVLADADTRASLLQSGMTAGHDGKFFLASTDGNFRLDLSGQIQVRYVLNSQRGAGDTPPNTDDGYRSGFEIRRARIVFSGHVVDPSWQYKIQGTFNRNGGDLVFEDVYIKKTFGGGWAVKAGSFKVPFNREELASDGRLLAVDRSLVNEAFNWNRGEGVELSYKGDQFAVYGYYGDGRDTLRTGWDEYGTEWAFAARAEVLFAGEWSQFRNMTSYPGSDLAFLLGGAFVAQSDEFGTVADTDELQQWGLTLDGSLHGDGWNVFASLFYTELDDDASVDANPWGVTIQGGLFVNDEVELYLRYEYGDNDAPDGTDLEDLNAITVGANWYFARQKLKWTTDFGYGFNGVNGVFGGAGGVGWRTDETGLDGQWVVRSQFQLLF